ncbi:MAG: DNA-directed RNA polymerase subunit beta [bacterium]
MAIKIQKNDNVNANEDAQVTVKESMKSETIVEQNDTYKVVRYGKKAFRRNYSKVRTEIELPDLIEIQTESYAKFVDEGLSELFRDISPIQNESGSLKLYFGEHKFEEAKCDIVEAKQRDINYSRALKVKVKLENEANDGEVIEKELFMGDFPYMTEVGTFVVNGAERVIISQIVRSSGVYYSKELDKKTGIYNYSGQVIPTRGAWVEYETASKGVWFAKLDRSKKIPVTTFLRAIGLSSNEEIIDLFGDSPFLQASFDKDTARDSKEAAIEVYAKLRQEKVMAEGAFELIITRLFDERRYDLQEVGRYKYNLKLDVLQRARNSFLAEDVVDENGEVILTAGTKLEKDQIDLLSANRSAFRREIFINKLVHTTNTGLTVSFDIPNENFIALETYEKHRVEMIKNDNNESLSYVTFNESTNSFEHIIKNEGKVIFSMVSSLNDVKGEDSAAFIQYIKQRGSDVEVTTEVVNNLKQPNPICEILNVKLENIEDLPVHTIIGNDQEEACLRATLSDIYAATSYYFNLSATEGELGNTDDIDHLGNRRLRLIGELLKNQFRIGFSKLEKNIKDRMSTIDTEPTPQNLINIKPLTSSLKEFFGSSQLSQFMDQINPLAELTQKRRISALGTGGIARDRAGVEVRDVHHSHYGRMCPIETPEGPSIGLITSLATYASVNKFGFIETPYLKVITEEIDGEKVSKVTNELVRLSADIEESYVIASASTSLDKKGYIIDENVIARRHGEPEIVKPHEVDLMDVSPKQIISAASSCIPFLEHDDASRALMGANMQRQAVPIINPEAPIVGTGMEYHAAHDCGSAVVASDSGIVEYVDAKVVRIKETNGFLKDYNMYKYIRSNQDTAILQRPIVKVGEVVDKGDIIADGQSMRNGELALGRNVRIGFMTWDGYNFEDAIIMNENLVKEDVYTSIHIDEYEIDTRETKLGKEEITREIPNVSPESTKFLDENGIIIKGTEVKAGDILVGKVTPKGETDPTPEERLLAAIFGEKTREVRDTSLRVPHGCGGIVHKVLHFKKSNGDELPPTINEVIRVYIVKKRKISEGDKMAGRHGNKGVISRILPEEDMPFTADGKPLDIMLNPQGVPSRMNIGQVLEIHLGMAAQKLGINVASPVFDGLTMEELQSIMAEAKMSKDGKEVVYDGRTGEAFENSVSVGVMYMIKLSHMVDDKLHARSVGPYTLVTQQPMGGKAQNGGQRFGEMEVWALEAYGAAHTLKEMLTVKSDDMLGRSKVFKAIVDGTTIPDSSLPESFRVLARELQALGIHVELMTKTGENEVAKSLVDPEDDYISVTEGTSVETKSLNNN